MAKYVRFQVSPQDPGPSPLETLDEVIEERLHSQTEEEFDAKALLANPHQFSDAEGDSSASESEPTSAEVLPPVLSPRRIS